MRRRRLALPSVLLAPVALVLMAACGQGPEAVPPLVRTTPPVIQTAGPKPTSDTIAWPQAARLITDCDVTFVTQAHSLDVWLTLRDGSSVHAVEPRIDEVFAVVRDAVADGCEQIALATE